MRTRPVLVASLAAAAAALIAAPALAHPFGPPPTARITAQGNAVTIDWSATPDDAVAIGELLDIMPPGSVAAYRQEGAAQVAPSGADEARLSASDLLAEYLTTHITVTQAGRQCEASVPAIADFVHRGARVVARCPAVVEEATLRITMLHDINDAYRTVGIGTKTDPAQSVFTTASPQFVWRFGVTPSSRPPLPALVAGGFAAAVLPAAAVVIIRRRRE